MLIKQISIFLENKSGRLADVTRTLAKNNINISALSIADTTDFGILRLIVNDPERAQKALKEEGFTVNINNVIAISVEDKPGGLADALEILENDNIGIEYMYAFVSRDSNKAMVILRVENPEKAIDVLMGNNILVKSSNQVYEL